eukprot:3935649-Rhodomonas_salina.1
MFSSRGNKGSGDVDSSACGVSFLFPSINIESDRCAIAQWDLLEKEKELAVALCKTGHASVVNNWNVFKQQA